MINRAAAPPAGKLDKFNLPVINSFSSDNGLKIYSVTKSKLPIVRIDFIVFAGSTLDPQDKAGLAELTAMTIDEGAGKYSALELAKEFEKLGSFFTVSAQSEFTSFSLFSLKENVKRSFELFAMVIQKPHFTEDDFTREQNKALTGLRRMSEEPNYLADIAFNKILFQNSSLEQPEMGFTKTIERISANDCRDFFLNNFSVQNSVLIITGDIDEIEIRNLVSGYLFDYKSGNSTEVITNNIYNKKTKIWLVDKENSVQSAIRIGKISSKRQKENQFVHAVLNSLLGGDFVSRINLNLREDKGYTYGANSSFVYYKDIANFEVSTSVESKNTVATISEIMKELNNVRSTITNGEIDFAKSSLTKKFPSLFESYEQINRNIFSQIYFSLPADYFDTYVESIEAITYDEVTQAAIKEIIPDEMQLVIVGNRKIFEKDLRNTFSDEICIIEKNELITGN